jgi:pimeloyl-ACP methyl ester carboxylesterase
MTILSMIAMTTSTPRAISSDGTPIAYLTVGTGPSVLAIPGALSTAADLLPFARALGARYTVHVIERRGRGASGPQGRDYSIDRECEDVLAVQSLTGARFLVGHSYGGLIALEAALSSDCFERVAVYEPGVAVNGSIGFDWMPAYARALQRGNPADAFVEFAIGARPQGSRTAPRWLMKRLLALAIPRAERARMYTLLDQNLREHEEVARLRDTYPRYAELRCRVLLMYGGKASSAGAARAIERVARVMSRARVFVFPALDHFGIQKKGAGDVARAVAEFFGD